MRGAEGHEGSARADSRAIGQHSKEHHPKDRERAPPDVRALAGAQDKPTPFRDLNAGDHPTVETLVKELTALPTSQITTGYAGGAAASSIIQRGAGEAKPGLEKSPDGEARMMNYIKAVIEQGEQPEGGQQSPSEPPQFTLPLGAASQISVVQDKNSVMRKLIRR